MLDIDARGLAFCPWIVLISMSFCRVFLELLSLPAVFFTFRIFLLYFLGIFGTFSHLLTLFGIYWCLPCPFFIFIIFFFTFLLFTSFLKFLVFVGHLVALSTLFCNYWHFLAILKEKILVPFLVFRQFFEVVNSFFLSW